jgi:hypothetical protein
MYLPISTPPASDAQHKVLSDLLAAQPDSYKPVAVVHSLSFAATFSAAAAAASMAEWLSVADRHAESSLRSVPFLWLGATAVGHLKPPAQPPSQGNGALWRYAAETEAEARKRGMDALGMYNLTLQASSWDGVSYGERVALVQAMSVSFSSFLLSSPFTPLLPLVFLYFLSYPSIPSYYVNYHLFALFSSLISLITRTLPYQYCFLFHFPI